MKSLMLLWKKVAEESATRCCTSTELDWKTVKCRVEHEGISFLTISLPEFGKAFERALDLGQAVPNAFPGFSTARWKDNQKGVGLPRFLGGFLERVFDRQSGTLLNEPDIDAILAIRQLTLMFGKISLECTPARERKAMKDFVECEQEVKYGDTARSAIDLDDFKRVSSVLFRSLFAELDRKIYDYESVPKHGPGSTADGLRGNAKYLQTTWTQRMERIFPSGEFLLPNWRYYDNLESVTLLEPEDEMPVKVISVPKTLKTPRIIAMEPTAMQYAQQGIQEMIRESLRRHPALYDMIGIDDQTPNQAMAHRGSLHKDLATLDLSEASDRVSNQLVMAMLSDYPHLQEAVDSTRSRRADVFGHGVIPLSKFASMGSALTFPIEAMVFLTMIFLGIERELNHPLTPRDTKYFRGMVRVYGDDIIIPVEYVHSVVASLERFGAKVNSNKSFWTGRFRESCGKEYFAGEDVSIVRVRDLFPTQRRDVDRVISIVSLRNQLYRAGYWQTCKWLDLEIRKVIKYFPTVSETSPVLGRFSFLGYETQKIGDRLHNPLVRGYVTRARLPVNKLDGEGALMKWFLKRGNFPFEDKNHLTHSGRAKSSSLQLGWFSPF